ncbi:MAG: GHKL domain-containing protein [Sedimentisphaerales bacterium]|nr:GHKL domain-containing protein [Sedimentisphaerales bacterium]
MAPLPKPPKNQITSGKTDKLRFGRMAQYLIEHLPLGVVAFDVDLNIRDSNPSAERMLLSGNNLEEALGSISVPNGAGCWRERLETALAKNQPSVFENVSANCNGRSLVLHIICTPLRDELKGDLSGGLLLLEDVTAKVAMENDLATAERLAAVGKLAARVAHELNNPLDGILRYINLSLRLVEQENTENVSKYLQESRKGLMRMVQIISELLEFSRSTYSAFEEADINKIVEDAVKAMQTQADNAGVEVQRDYSKDMPNIRSGNLFQVFCNLIKNACDAMPGGGRLDIATRCDDHHVIMEFADTGTGLNPEVREKLFDAFFTTKPTGKGTGLGLAICKDIVERYGGQITADNRTQGGAIFHITIPLERTSRGQA